MRAAVITRYGPARDVTVSNAVPEPDLGPEGVRVRVAAAGLNPIDWKLVTGALRTGKPLAFPFTPGSDFAGRVVDVGDDVEGLAAGHPVYGMASTHRGGSGALAEVVVASTVFIAHIPRGLALVEAAAVPMAGLRAWNVVHEWLQVRRGERILIHGGAGGIGTFAIQVAKHQGAWVAATASGRDLDFVRSLGADEAIDYRTQDFTASLRGLDAVFDTVGGETFARSFQVLRRGGRLATMLGDSDPARAAKRGVTVVAQGESATPRAFAELGTLLEIGAVKPEVDRVFPFDEVGAALEHLEQGHPRGKVVVDVAGAR